MEDDHKKTLEKYKNRLSRKREIYQLKYKNDPEFQQRNRERARAHYEKNKQKERSLKLYRYYIRHKSVEEFIDYHPDKFLLISNKFTLDEIDELI
tara:strand:- start:687 stop:971 length:285 start_codon:yes stop_codon:yes gene_type:complete